MEEKKIIIIATTLITIIILGYGISALLQKPTISSTNPTNNKEGVDPKTSIEITFNKPVSTSTKDNILIIPETEGVFSFNNKSLIFRKPKKVIFTPSKDLFSSTPYLIEMKEPKSWLGIKGDNYNFSFTIKYIPEEELSPEQLQREINASEGGGDE